MLALRLDGVIRGAHKLLSRQCLEVRVTKSDLRADGRTWCIRLLVDLDHVADHVLNIVVMPLVTNARRNPREKVRHRAAVNGLGFGELLAGDLYIQILRAREPQRCGQINLLSRIRHFAGHRTNCRDARECGQQRQS